MADEETFDIDIYGDEGQDQEQPQQSVAQAQDDENLFDDEHNAQYGFDGAAAAPHNEGEHEEQNVNGATDSTESGHNDSTGPAQRPPQGTKRKAPSDEEDATPTPQATNARPSEPGALPALKLSELHWWTTEEDVRAFCSQAGVEDQLRDISFGEHKINGKSRGEAYLEFSSAQAASAVKKAIEVKEPTKDGGEKRANPFHVYFASVGNPYKGRDSGAAGKKEFTSGAGSQARNGPAYNNFRGGGGGGYGNRGNYGGRGGGFVNNNRGGGYQQNNANMGQQGWGMNNGMYGNMGRGGMGNMMGRGGFGGGMNPMMNMGMGMGNMANMMGMAGRGGMMGGYGNMGRGGGMMGMQGGGGFGGGGFGMGMMGQNQNQGQGQGQGQAAKRMKEG